MNVRTYLTRVKIGFPPKNLNVSNETLKVCGIRNGEQILLIPQNTQGSTTQVHDNHTIVSKSSDGVLVVREMKDDNSCLFRSIAYLVEGDAEKFRDLRRKIAEFILQNQIEYSQVVLGKPVLEYVDWIQNSNSWGGAIELAIFSQIYKLEIDSIDINSGRVDRFGQDKYETRILLLYSGIHYDVIVLTPQKGISKEFDVKSFPVSNDQVLEGALDLAKVLKKEHKYTDLANFALKCGICFMGLKGQKEAQKHAMETGHAEFTEYS
jgi:ubiquitin thioesterase OTU1